MSTHAATLDFSGLPFVNASPLVLSNATLSTDGVILVGASAAGQLDGFCFGPANVSSCIADGQIAFSTAINGLAFDVDEWQSGDSVAITAFNGATSLGTIVSAANEHLDFSAFGTLTRLVFDDSSTHSGVGYSTFEFNVIGVPEPASLALVALGLLGVGLRRSRAL